MKLTGDNDFFIRVNFNKVPKFKVNDLIEHKRTGIYKVLATHNGIYLLSTIVWKSENIRLVKDKIQKGSYTLIEDIYSFKKYRGSQAMLHREILKNKVDESKK